jgi:hypothetical protein
LALFRGRSSEQRAESREERNQRRDSREERAEKREIREERAGEYLDSPRAGCLKAERRRVMGASPSLVAPTRTSMLCDSIDVLCDAGGTLWNSLVHPKKERLSCVI